jgi:hypothetical protein
MTRNEHRLAFSSFLSRMDERFIGGIYAALKSQYKRFRDDYVTNGKEHAVFALNSRVMNPNMAEAVTKVYKQAGVYMAQKTLSNLNKTGVLSARNGKTRKQILNKHFRAIGKETELKYSTFGFNDEWVSQMIAYFRMHLLEKVAVGITETTRQIILNKLEQATEQGWSNDQIVAEIYNLPEIRNRARMIVRTETVRAANFGVLQGAEKYDYEVEKEWLSVHDNRTRATHRHGTGVDGETRDVDGTFSNGLKFPGDPDGPASETISCRCTLLINPVRDARGRLIPKQRLIAA